MADLVLQRLPEKATATLDWPHLAERTNLLVRLLQNAVATGERGINVLLYGAPGTGKSQYAQQLVKQVGACGYAVSEQDVQGDAANRSERLSSLMLTQVFAPARNSIIVLDEAEDVFQTEYNDPLARAFGRKDDSKGWMNAVLEANRHPVIWISNRVEHIDPAYLRRFTWCIEFPRTPRKVRMEIARRYLEPAGCSDALVRTVAAWSDASPGLVASAARSVSLSRLKGTEADRGARVFLGDMLAAAGSHARTDLPERAARFDMRYLNVTGAVTPIAVVDAIQRTGRARAILSGPPGTGKTQLAAEVATRLGRELVYRTASDINSMWFGASERNVARMFRDCDQDAEVLFLDEADSLLGSRDAAQNRPEHAVTAEFLRQVEAFRGVFICATNYAGRLDAALLRRFEFRLEFLPLAPAQRLELFCECAMAWSPASGEPLPAIDDQLRLRLDRLDLLTPGDFANVVRRVESLRLSLDARGWLDELVCEHEAKPGAARQHIGFL